MTTDGSPESTEPLFLGIDIGTTGARAVLIDPAGRVRAAGAADYPMHTPRPLWAEQAPGDWWQGAVMATRQALAADGVAAAAISGIGLTGQMHSTVFLDDRDRVVRPAILWCDQRTEAECAWISERVGPERLAQIACNPALTGFSAPKIVWLRAHEPETFARVRRVLLPKDYLRFLLTGERATDVTDASGTLLLDVPRRTWSGALFDRLEIDPAWLPVVYESAAVTGTISPAAAEATGLRAGTPVVAGAGDQAAGAIGNGIVRPGVVSATIGTSGVVFAFAAQPSRGPLGRIHTFCHAIPAAWHVMGVTLAAGLSLRWFRDTFGLATAAGASDPYAALAAEAADAGPGADGLLFLPYLMGERTPHLDTHARGVLFGLTARHCRRHVVRAILEGVAFSLRDILDIFDALGVAADEVRLSGGGARSPLWRQIQADVFGRRAVVPSTREGPAFGAALLAAVGTGAFVSAEAACDATISIASEVAPDPSTTALYHRLYGIYRELYPALRPQFRRLAAAVDD